MNRELKILAVVVFFTLVTYWGVEPFAHSQMHKHVEFHDFAYKDLPALKAKGDPKKGKELVTGAGACTGCHGIKADGMAAPMDAATAIASYGVNPPDLSHVGELMDERFLAALIKNPAHALKVEHKFNDKRPFPMTSFMGAGGDIDQEVADMVAYLKQVAAKKSATAKEAYETSCGRCHAMRYDKWTQLGETPKFKYEKDEVAYKAKVLDAQDKIKAYMGKLPPDLSIIIRARSEEFLKTFVENPQSQLPGTAMPRVGVTPEGYDKVVKHLEEVGDPSKPARESLGWKVILYFVIFSILAYLWKQKIWSKLH